METVSVDLRKEGIYEYISDREQPPQKGFIKWALTGRSLKTALIVTAWDDRDWIMKDIRSHYETLCRYLNFQDMGQILGTGCGTVSMTKGTGFPGQAYELGKSL